MAKLQGAFTALITPMSAGGEVDYDGFRRLLGFQLESGIDGVLPLGTTGETPTLTDDEEGALAKIALEACRAYGKRAVPVILGAGSNSTRDSVRYAERAAKLGADYALVVTPYYNKPSDEGVFQHFKAVSAVGIPIIIYNIAGRTGKNISTPLLRRISDLPNIAGVKEASGSIVQIMEVIETVVPAHPDFAVLSGDDALTLPLMGAGGDGIISVVSNLAPAEITALVAAALKGDFAAARRLHYKLLPFMRAAFIETNPCPIKFALARKGLPSGALRLPLVPVSKASEEIITDAMRQSGLL
ncbi:4-hydroxy-tetrahydrodipicolinate synthase [Treponema endosymbiont of Eucomonympha sp.]|uniref:4-hydroxy-tetrahydrodipicolinate synthase n=2 Tax=Treponema endosymbiont of Eucomonympha sp. TaxID=1580831 RepID=UPI000750AB7B|nr:4-hydroxy-tetrahydrodipicolinate synthase [Treponema endosymbiont of Eucomonympha sp.]